MRGGLATFLFALLLSLPAAAESGNPAFMEPGPVNNTDVLFSRSAAIGNLAEIRLGELAGRAAESDAVKAFAKVMVDDHSKANDRLKSLAVAAKIPLPGDVDPEKRAAMERLDKLNSRQFDLQYLVNQVGEHQKTVQLLAWEIGSGQNADIKAFASETLPTVLRHLALARETLDRLRSGPMPN